MKKRWVRVSLVAKTLVLLAVAGVVVADVKAEPGVAHPGYDDFIQYNMWGRAGNEGALDPGWRVVDHVKFMTDDGHTPLSVSAQEVCYRPQTLTQATVISNGLWDYAVSLHTLVQFDPDDEPLCTNYGNLLAMLGPIEGPNEASFLAYDVSPDFGEDRGVLCGHAFVFSWHNACSTHLTSQGQQPGGAQQQLPSVLSAYTDFISSEYPGSSARYLGGDLNMTPSEMAAVITNPYNIGLIEADDCCNSVTYPGDGRKIDYSFVPDSLYGVHQARIWSTPESDHYLLEGHFDKA
jgi:hypothetical protein